MSKCHFKCHFKCDFNTDGRTDGLTKKVVASRGNIPVSPRARDENGMNLRLETGR